MSTILRSRPNVKPIRKPVVASLVLTINGQAYDVEPIGNAPAGLRSYRLAKCSGDGATYDLDAFADRVECSCPSYQKTHAGTSSLCKHGKSLVTVGLVDHPKAAEAPAVEAQPDARDAYNDHREKLAAIAESEAEVRTQAEPPAHVVAPTFDRSLYTAQNAVSEGRGLWLGHRHLHTSEPLPPRMTLNSSKGHSAEPRDIRLIDDDGTPLETSAEMDRRHREEQAASVAKLMEGNPFLPTARQAEPIPCCEPAEAQPCEACATVHTPLHTLPDDLSGDDWQDEFVWNANDDAPAPDGWLPSADELHQAEEDGFFEQSYGEAPLAHATPECFAAVAAGRADWAREFGYVPSPGWVTTENAEDLIIDEVVAEGWGEYRDRERAEGMRARKAEMEAKADEPEARTLEEQVEDHARELRAIGSPLHDLLAERAEQLAAEVRFLDASTVGQYRDRREAALDAARDAAEARQAARCC